MAGLNKVILVGNLGKDPEVVTFSQDNRSDNSMAGVIKKASFPLATTEMHRNRDGEKIEQTEWHNVVCWRGLADIAERLLHKGTMVYIEGKLQSRSREDRDGNKSYITEVVAESFTVLNNRSRVDEQPSINDPYANILNADTDPMGDLPF